MDHTLLLNADYDPIRLLSWERAISLQVQDRVYLVEAWPGEVVRSPSVTLPRPAVVALSRYVRLVRGPPPSTRRNVLLRDRHACQYCGATSKDLGALPTANRLTIDHVVPQSRAIEGMVHLPWLGRSVPVGDWRNVVTACGPCNGAKSARLPHEAGMPLASWPSAPDARSLWMARLGHGEPPALWRPYLGRRFAA